MFAVIYRAYLKPGTEAKYLECWKTVATYFVNTQGALGSTLHKTQDEMWVAYSRWPDKATRDASWPQDQEKINSEFPADISKAISELKNCLDNERYMPEICMQIQEVISC